MFITIVYVFVSGKEACVYARDLSDNDHHYLGAVYFSANCYVSQNDNSEREIGREREREREGERERERER